MLVDVEPYHRERIASLRDDASAKCQELWRETALGKGESEILPLPVPYEKDRKIVPRKISK